MSQLISMMVGRELAEFYPKRNLPVGDTLMEVKDLTINGIIDRISFTLRGGEIVGLFGLLGSGRMNVLRALYGLDGYDGGEIVVKGVPADHSRSPTRPSGTGIGYMPIDRKLEGLALGLPGIEQHHHGEHRQNRQRIFAQQEPGAPEGGEMGHRT